MTCSPSHWFWWWGLSSSGAGADSMVRELWVEERSGPRSLGAAGKAESWAKMGLLPQGWLSEPPGSVPVVHWGTHRLTGCGAGKWALPVLLHTVSTGGPRPASLHTKSSSESRLRRRGQARAEFMDLNPAFSTEAPHASISSLGSRKLLWPRPACFPGAPPPTLLATHLCPSSELWSTHQAFPTPGAFGLLLRANFPGLLLAHSTPAQTSLWRKACPQHLF